MTLPGLFGTDPAAFDTAAVARVASLAEELTRMACIARVLLSHGRSVELGGLDNGAGLLCAKALDLPAEGGRAVVPHLTAFRAELDQLTAAMRMSR